LARALPLRRLRVPSSPQGALRLHLCAAALPGKETIDYTTPTDGAGKPAATQLALRRRMPCGRHEKLMAGHAYKYIRFEIANHLARISLNQPPYNVLSIPLMKEMAEAIGSLNGSATVKCIVLDSTSPKAFSAGISLEDSKPDRVFQTLDAFNSVFQAIAEISKPLIVVVNGPAIGAGSELVAFGDMVIATPNARFAQPEVKMGVFPPFAAVMLPALIGPKKAYELILTGQSLSAEEAQSLGFVNRVVPESDLQQAVDEIVSRIGEFSAPVLEMTKAVIGGSVGMPLDQALKKSQDIYLNQLMALEDVREGLRARLEQRKAVWKNK